MRCGAFYVVKGIYLQRVRSWCVSTDREFAPKAAEIVEFVPQPTREKALMLSVDEKPSLQAIERPSGYVETDSGAVVRALKSTYKPPRYTESVRRSRSRHRPSTRQDHRL